MKKTQAKLYREAGVDYCIPPFLSHEIVPEGFESVTYYWRHIPTGRMGPHAVLVRNPADIVPLLVHWNRPLTAEWEYTQFP